MTLIITDIQRAADLLSKGEPVAIPTETVYGLAANIYDEAAIKKIFEIKGRPDYNPLIVHIGRMEQLEELVTMLPSAALKLADAFWPGPLTLLLPKKHTVPDLVTAGKQTVAIRLPNHPLTLALLQLLPFPLAAPSANPFGSISPTQAVHVKKYFEGQLQLVLEGGNCTAGIESTIVGFDSDQPVIYRQGSVSIESIEAVVGKVHLKTTAEKAPESPGMLLKHYAPQTPALLTRNINELIDTNAGKKIGVLVFKNAVMHPAVMHQEILSTDGNFQEAAANLYTALHRLDQSGADIIIAERLPDINLGRSINDRLERATYR